MSIAELAVLTTSRGGIGRAVVAGIEAGRARLSEQQEVGSDAWYDILDASDEAPRLEVGDEVLVWQSGRSGERGVVLGRIGIVRRSEPDPPEEIVVEARESVTLRCGDGSITIRKDGKILIKGKDLVSQAKRSNRIKGGSVAIN